LICYATSPVQRVVGYCKVRGKSEATQPFFPQETAQGEVIWPLRVTLSVEKMAPPGHAEAPGINPERRGIMFQRALQRLPDEIAIEIIQELDGA
jgi:hypothetical protein